MAKRDPLIRLGDWVDGYQVIDQAPADLIRGSRTRALDGHLITGSWSDPWWLYSMEKGFAVAKRWRNKAQDVTGDRGEDGRLTWAEFPARDELVIGRWVSGPRTEEESTNA